MNPRDELLGKIAKGTAYLQRNDITPNDRVRTKDRLDELRAELRKMDELPPRLDDPRADKAIAEIREILSKNRGAG